MSVAEDHWDVCFDSIRRCLTRHLDQGLGMHHFLLAVNRAPLPINLTFHLDRDLVATPYRGFVFLEYREVGPRPRQGFVGNT